MGWQQKAIVNRCNCYNRLYGTVPDVRHCNVHDGNGSFAATFSNARERKVREQISARLQIKPSCHTKQCYLVVVCVYRPQKHSNQAADKHTQPQHVSTQVLKNHITSCLNLDENRISRTESTRHKEHASDTSTSIKTLHRIDSILCWV